MRFENLAQTIEVSKLSSVSITHLFRGQKNIRNLIIKHQVGCQVTNTEVKWQADTNVHTSKLSE